MSMISAQCDELRELATRYDELQVGAVKAVTMPSDMASILREAADTIWQLRCRLVDAEDRVRKSGELCKLCEREAENRKLREQGARLFDKTLELGTENAKLRELVRDYEHCNMHADCDRCEYDGTTSTHCPLSPCVPDIDELRELGVEVDG